MCARIKAHKRTHNKHNKVQRWLKTNKILKTERKKKETKKLSRTVEKWWIFYLIFLIKLPILLQNTDSWHTWSHPLHARIRNIHEQKKLKKKQIWKKVNNIWFKNFKKRRRKKPKLTDLKRNLPKTKWKWWKIDKILKSNRKKKEPTKIYQKQWGNLNFF